MYLCSMKPMFLNNLPLKLLAIGLWLVAISCSSSSVRLDGTEEEREYDALQRKAKWEQTVEKSVKEPVQSLACRKVVCLAKLRLRQAGPDALYECLADSKMVLSSELAAMMMSDVYVQLGMVTMAQRAAFEAMVKKTDVVDCERPLRRLTETALITGQYELALKYIAIVEEHFSSDDWVREMKPLALHPELLRQHPVFNQLRENYEKMQDQFFL